MAVICGVATSERTRLISDEWDPFDIYGRLLYIGTFAAGTRGQPFEQGPASNLYRASFECADAMCADFLQTSKHRDEE
jgi:hypothetical protein